MSFIPATKSSGWPRRGIPFTLASDVHSHAQLGKDYDAWRKRWRVAACAKWLFTIDIGDH